MKCDGCGVSSLELHTHVRVGPALTLWVCAVYGGGSNRPKKSCLTAAILKACRCPGCGAEDPRAFSPTLCDGCERALVAGRREQERLRDAVAKGAPDEVALTLVDPYSMLFDGQGGATRQEADAVGEALCGILRGAPVDPRAAVGHWPRSLRGDNERLYGGGHCAFEATIDGAAARCVVDLMGAVRGAVERSHREGFGRGASVLRRLASGDMGVLAFEEEVRRRGDAPTPTDHTPRDGGDR